MEVAKFLQFLLVILMMMFISEISFYGASADYAPEKMDPDDEAYQEMNLEPRSSIPHPANSVPVTPAAIQSNPQFRNQINNANTNKPIRQSPQTQQTANVTSEQKVNNTFITKNSATKPDVEPNAAPIATASNQIPPNVTNPAFVPQPIAQNSNLVPQTSAQTTVDQAHLSTMNERPTSLQNNNMSAPVAKNEQNIAPESVSFGTPSKPLTPIKSIQNTNVNEEESEDKNRLQLNTNVTLKPTTATMNKSTNAPTVIVQATTAQVSGNTSANVTANEPNENKDRKVAKASKMEVNEGSSPKVDLDASGSGDDDEEEEPESPNNTPHIQEKENDKEDDDDNDDNDDDNIDGSGSGEEENEDNAKPFLHDNHTLTSTSGDVKIQIKQAKPIEENNEEDPDMENAVENALDKETNSEDTEEKDEPGQQKHKRPELEDNEKLDESKDNVDIMKMEKPSKAKANTNIQKPLESNNSLKKSSDTENQNKDERKPHFDEIKPLQMPKTLKRIPAVKNHKEKTKADKVEMHPQTAQVVHKKQETKASKMQQAKHLKPISKAEVYLNESVVKQEKKIYKKPLLKYIHRAVSPVKIDNKNTPQKCNSDEIKTGYSLKGGTRAGHVSDLGGSASIHGCIKRCCNKKVCDVALLLDGRCFGVSCFSKELCQPVAVPHPHYVSSQIAFLNQAERRTEVERARPEFDCKYGELTIRNNHRWSGELCGGVVSCKNGIIHLEKCPDIPPKPKDCANAKLYVKQRPGECCIKKWHCKDKSCMYGQRRIPHGISLSDPLCTGVITCFNGHLKTTTCPDIPDKPTNCANPQLKIITVPGNCCRRKWVCQDKSCTYNKLKIDHGERLTDASCAGIMECNNGYLHFKQCPSPPAIPHGCLNPRLITKRLLGECCQMKWTCATDI